MLVTGAGGFIGTAVVRALDARGARVRALLGAPGQPVREPPVGVTVARAEIDDAPAILALATGCDAIAHLAGPASVAASFHAPAEHARVHVAGTATLLEAALRAGVRRVVHISSAEVYDRVIGVPVTEDHRQAARSPYGAAKIGAEQLVTGYFRALGGDAIILRPFSIYGPGLPATSLLGAILRQCRRNNVIEIEDLGVVRDYCFIDDVADAVLRACEAPPGLSGAFNVGTGVGTSAAELARLALRAAGRSMPIRAAAVRRRPEGATTPWLVADTTRARCALGWSAATPLGEGIARTVHWLRSTGEGR